MRPNPGVGDCYAAWAEELESDPDKDFLLHGIQYGFDIVDPAAQPVPVDTDNNSSAQPGSVLYEQATQQILSEIEHEETARNYQKEIKTLEELILEELVPFDEIGYNFKKK